MCKLFLISYYKYSVYNILTHLLSRLEQYLQNWPTTLLVISHDFSFLDAVVNMIFHLHSEKIDTYRGDFVTFLKSKTDKLKAQQSEYEAQQAERAHIQAFIDRFRVNANRAALVQSKIKMLERMPMLREVVAEKDVVFKFPDVDNNLAPPILQLEEVTFHYSPDCPMFKKIDISANMESRICLVGENGAGKSTLLKLLIKDLEPVEGYSFHHRHLRVGYFSQHFVDQLTMEDSPVTFMMSQFPGTDAEHCRRLIGRFGLSGEIAMRPISTLSGGRQLLDSTSWCLVLDTLESRNSPFPFRSFYKKYNSYNNRSDRYIKR